MDGFWADTFDIADAGLVVWELEVYPFLGGVGVLKEQLLIVGLINFVDL